MDALHAVKPSQQRVQVRQLQSGQSLCALRAVRLRMGDDDVHWHRLSAMAVAGGLGRVNATIRW